jgi:hypothetical protein
MKELDIKIFQSMMFVGASLGLLSPNMRCAALEMEDERTFRLHFVLQQESPLDRAAIKLITENFWASQSEPRPLHSKLLTVESAISVSMEPILMPMPKELWPVFMQFDGDNLLDEEGAEQ